MRCLLKTYSLVGCLVLGSLGCGAEPEDSGTVPYRTLSEYGFFRAPMAEFDPVDGVLPYEVTIPSWADHTGKGRFIVLPPGQRISVTGDEGWNFPEGTIVIKNFHYRPDQGRDDGSTRPIETRLLIREGGTWTGHTYIWNEDSTEAIRKVSGARVQLTFVSADGESTRQEYVVPNTNQCKDCHEIDDTMNLLGVVTRQLGRSVIRGGQPVSQLDWLAEQGAFEGPPPAPLAEGGLVDPFGDASLERRARSYLDVNCGHCHRPGGNGGRSGLVLLASETDPRAYGVCKGPVAAGAGSGDRHHDIVPGQPERSILIYRMESTDPEIKMPEIPNRLPDLAGVELVSAWIRALDGPLCQ